MFGVLIVLTAMAKMVFQVKSKAKKTVRGKKPGLAKVPTRAMRSLALVPKQQVLPPKQQVTVRNFNKTPGMGLVDAHRAAAGKNQFGEDVEAYAAATFFPFTEAAVGARVPEPYAVRTRTTRVVTPFRVTPSNSGNSAGVFDAIVLPNVLNTVVSNQGTWAGGANTQFLYVSGASIPSNMLACTTQANLSAAYTAYRVVGMGVRLKCDSSYNNTSGRIYVAVVPAMPQAPAYFDSVATVADTYAAVGAPFDSLSSAVNGDIVSYPNASEFSVTDLMEEGGVEIMVPRTSARALDFLVGNMYSQNAGLGWQGFALQAAVGVGSIGGTQYEGNNTTVLTNVQATNAAHITNGTTTADYANLTRCGVDPTIYSTAGFSTVLIRGEGLTSGTNSTTLTMEVVFHLEGEVAPVASSGASTVLVDDSMSRALAPRAHTDIIDIAAQFANPISIGMKECGANVIAAVKKYVADGGLKKLAGGAAKVLGLLM